MINIKKVGISAVFGLLLMILLRYGSNDNNLILKIFVITFSTLFIFNLAVRRIAWFQPYYTSRFNILSSKFKVKKTYDFSKDILFHKIIEVVKNSNFKVFHIDENKGIIMAATRMTWFSWGENIYITLEESGNGTIMNFCSTGLFGIYSWGKNEQNYHELLTRFDASLTI